MTWLCWILCLTGAASQPASQPASQAASAVSDDELLENLDFLEFLQLLEDADWLAP